MAVWIAVVRGGQTVAGQVLGKGSKLITGALEAEITADLKELRGMLR